MRIYSTFLLGALCATVVSPAVSNVATTAGSNLTAYNGTGAMNNNQWNSLMNGRAGMAQNLASANFGNCNAVILRCASPKCASGGCTDMTVAAAIVAGCVNSNESCKQYGDDLVQYITAQVVAQSTAKIQEQQNALAMAQAQAEAQAAAQAATAKQNDAQMQQMQAQMAAMQQQMAESMNAMQQQMAAQAESQTAQIQNAIQSQNTASANTYTGETGAVISGLEGLGVAEQLAAKNGISTDILVREQMGGQIETAIEDATLKMKELKKQLDDIIEYAECDPGVTACKGPKRVKKFKDMANDFFDPYEEVLENMYNALLTAMTLGIDVSDTIMLLSDSCNIWGKYMCDPCSPKDKTVSVWEDKETGEMCVCNKETKGTWSDCYYRVTTTEDSSKGRKTRRAQNHCRMVDSIKTKEEVWHEWIDPNSGIGGSIQVACASDVIEDMSIFSSIIKRKKTTLDIETLRDLINQDSYGRCNTPKDPNNFNVLEDCGAKFCNVTRNDPERYAQLEQAYRTKKLPAQTLTGAAKNRLCFADEKDFTKFDHGGSSNNETGNTQNKNQPYQNLKNTITHNESLNNAITAAVDCIQYNNNPTECNNHSGCTWGAPNKQRPNDKGCVATNNLNAITQEVLKWQNGI